MQLSLDQITALNNSTSFQHFYRNYTHSVDYLYHYHALDQGKLTQAMEHQGITHHPSDVPLTHGCPLLSSPPGSTSSLLEPMPPTVLMHMQSTHLTNHMIAESSFSTLPSPQPTSIPHRLHAYGPDLHHFCHPPIVQGQLFPCMRHAIRELAKVV